ncbi:MAG: hypothetical protein QOC60_1150 [Frankiaceae bacterium]|jgi:uncharacterized cupredoxin-like copper-binding protein|nr:hypothetical protein [Frankiaceae bacterium]
MASRRTVLVAALLALPGLAACAAKTTAGAGSTAVAISASDTVCDLGVSTVPAGATKFHATNNGSKTTEVYVYGLDGGAFTKVVGEVENIGPGTSRDLTATLTDATYEVACKPGQTGDGIRTKLTVTGGAAAAASTPVATADRQVVLLTDGKAITGAPATAKTGETIEFTLTNNGPAPRALEFKDPAGAVAGVSASIQPGQSGKLTVRLDKPGTWDVNVEGDNVPDITVRLTVG